MRRGTAGVTSNRLPAPYEEFLCAVFSVAYITSFEVFIFEDVTGR
jgi:hypothetical protein